MRLGLTYDDVLLVPQRSGIRSRKDVSTKTYLTGEISLNIPIISANMDTVTESEMAITMATLGGIGIIHRFLTIEEQIREVARVKRYEQYVVENPVIVQHSDRLGLAKELMNEHHISSVLVANKQNILLGIITARDFMFETDDQQKVSIIMTPRNKLITAAPTISFEKAKEILRMYRVEKLPLVDKTGKIKGLITARNMLRTISYPLATKDKKGQLMVGAAIGVRTDAMERAEKLIKSGCDVLVVDIAHGHADHALNLLTMLKKKFTIPVIAGNVATKEGTRDLIAAGADGIKVGIGPGSMCTTRIVAASGVPQMTAIMDAASVAKPKGIPLIADGGIKVPGDVSKAIAAGASTVMIGGLFAGTSQSPGLTVIRNGKKFKVSRGMASVGANIDRTDDQGLQEYVAEGVEAFIPFRGDAAEIVNQLVGGLRSGMSYTGVNSIPEFWQKAKFIQITQAGLKESFPHDVEVM